EMLRLLAQTTRAQFRCIQSTGRERDLMRDMLGAAAAWRGVQDLPTARATSDRHAGVETRAAVAFPTNRQPTSPHPQREPAIEIREPAVELVAITGDDHSVTGSVIELRRLVSRITGLT